MDIRLIIVGLFVATILFFVLFGLRYHFSEKDDNNREDLTLRLWHLTNSLQKPARENSEALISQIVAVSERLGESLNKKRSTLFEDIVCILILAFVLLMTFYSGVNWVS